MVVGSATAALFYGRKTSCSLLLLVRAFSYNEERTTCNSSASAVGVPCKTDPCLS